MQKNRKSIWLIVCALLMLALCACAKPAAENPPTQAQVPVQTEAEDTPEAAPESEPEPDNDAALADVLAQVAPLDNEKTTYDIFGDQTLYTIDMNTLCSAPVHTETYKMRTAEDFQLLTFADGSQAGGIPDPEGGSPSIQAWYLLPHDGFSVSGVRFEERWLDVVQKFPIASPAIEHLVTGEQAVVLFGEGSFSYGYIRVEDGAPTCIHYSFDDTNLEFLLADGCVSAIFFYNDSVYMQLPLYTVDTEAEDSPKGNDATEPRVFTSDQVDAALYMDAAYADEIVSDSDFELFIPATDQTIDFSSAVWFFFDESQKVQGKVGLVWAITACPIDGLDKALEEDCNNQDLCFPINCHILGTDNQTVYMLTTTDPSAHAVRQYDAENEESAASYFAHAEAGKKILEDFVQKNALDVPSRASDWGAWYDKWMLGGIEQPSFTGGITLFAGNDTALVNSEPIKMEAAPFIENDAFYIPLRFVAETMGWDYQYTDGTVRLQHGYHWTELTAGSQTICADGKKANVSTENIPVERDGVFFMPLNFLGTRTDNNVCSSLGFYCQEFLEEGYAIVCGSGKENGIGGFYVFDVYDALPEAQRSPMQELGVVGVSREAYDVVEYGADGLFVHVLRLKEGCENEDQLDGLICAVYTTNPDHSTPRGLRVGESISRIYTTYDANFHMRLLCITDGDVITKIRFSSYYDEDESIREQPTCLHMDAAEAA